MQISVIVPSYRRAQDLQRCLAALSHQTRRPDEVIIVARSDDSPTAQIVQESRDLPLRSVFVSEPGVVAAMNVGLGAALGDIIALTDDDAAPWTDWLARIEQMFESDARLGGVGGKDWQYKGKPLTLDDGAESRSGELQWWGRVIGDHHHATAGPPREVVVVKGVNCGYRTEALRQVGGFDTRLLGGGAQVHWELSLGLAIRRAGWKIVFDPALGVDHFPAERFDEDRRGQFIPEAQRNMVFNETIILCEEFRGMQRAGFLAWAVLIGTRGAPGLLQVPRLLLERRADTISRWTATIAGRIAGWRSSRISTRAPGFNDLVTER